MRPEPVFPNSQWGVQEVENAENDSHKTTYIRKKSLQCPIVSIWFTKEKNITNISTFRIEIFLESETDFLALSRLFTNKKQSHFIQKHGQPLDYPDRYYVSFLTTPDIHFHAAILESIVEFSPTCVDVKTHFFSKHAIDQVSLLPWISVDIALDASPEMFINVCLRGMPIQTWVSNATENSIKAITILFDIDKFDFTVITTEPLSRVQTDLPFKQIGDVYSYTLTLCGYTGDLFTLEKERCFEMLAKMNAGNLSFREAIETFFEKVRREITENTDTSSNRGASFFQAHKISRELAISTFLKHTPDTLPLETKTSIEQLKMSCNPGVLRNQNAKRLTAANVSDDQIPEWMICCLSGLVMDAPCIDRTTLHNSNETTIPRIDYAFLLYSVVVLGKPPEFSEEEDVAFSTLSVEERAKQIFPRIHFLSPLTRQEININSTIADHDRSLQLEIDEFVVRKEIEAEYERSRLKFT